MGEPRDFYYPLQDEAADIDRVVHDLVEITDDESSIDNYVKVIEIEGQPHFTYGPVEEGKSINVNEWEVPVGDGNNWVRKSKFYTPFQEGTLVEDVLPADITDLTLTLKFDDFRYGESDSSPLSSIIWRVLGVIADKTGYNYPIVISEYITKNMFDNLFNDESNLKLNILAANTSSPSSYEFEETEIVYNSEEDNYDVFLQDNNNNYKIATLSYNDNSTLYSDDDSIKIVRYFIPYGNNYYTLPCLKFNFTYHINNIDFSRYIYKFGVAAADSYNLGIYYDLMGYCKATTKVLSHEWDSFYETPLTTTTTVKAGIYSIGPIIDHANLDVLYIGQLKIKDNKILPVGGIRNNGTYSSIPYSDGPGITMKKNSCIIIENGGLNLQNSGITMHNQAAINMDGAGIMNYIGSGDDAWDGTFAGHNQHGTETPYLHLHGMSKIIMDNKALIMMGAGAFLDMGQEAYCAIHGLSKIDISGAPWIHIHGNRNRDNSSGETLKYGLSTRQPSIFIDDGTKLSFSGNNYGDPFVFMKGCSGIVFNNHHGVPGNETPVPDPTTDNLGPLFMINEDSFYFDGFGTSGATGYENSFGFDIQPLDLSKETLNKYTDPVWESMQEELSITGQCEFTNARISKLYEMLGRASLPYYYNPIRIITSEYIQQVGEALEDYLQTIAERPETFKKYYYIKASKYDEAMTIASEISNSIFSTNEYGYCLTGEFFGSTIVEDKFIEKGLNINDYVLAITYKIYFGGNTAAQTLENNFLDYYYNLYGTRTLSKANVIYRQSFIKETDLFLKYYYNVSLADYADLNAAGTMMTMELNDYFYVDQKYTEYDNNKNSFSWYITTDYSTYLAVKDTFERVASAYYTVAFPCFQERFYAGNSIVILGGDRGSRTWFKVGGKAGTFTDVYITDNAKILIQGNTDFNIENGSFNIENSEFELKENTQFKIEDSGITVQDGTGSINLTVEQIAELFNPEPPEPQEWPQIDYTNMTQNSIRRPLQAISCSLQNLEAGILLVGFISTVGVPSVGPDSSWSLLQAGTLTSDNSRNISVYTKIATAGTNSFSITTPNNSSESLIVMVAIPEANTATIENIETQIVFTNNKAELDATTNGHRLYVYFSNSGSNGLSIPSPAPDGLNHPWIQNYSLVNLIYQYHATDDVTELTGVSAVAADVSGKFDLWVLNFVEPGETIEAADVAYDNTTSGLAATDVQDALDEVVAAIPTVPSTYDADDINYDNTTSGLTATNIQDAVDELAQGGGSGASSADDVSYDNTSSGLTSTNVQDAIDEVLQLSGANFVAGTNIAFRNEAPITINYIRISFLSKKGTDAANAFQIAEVYFKDINDNFIAMDSADLTIRSDGTSPQFYPITSGGPNTTPANMIDGTDTKVCCVWDASGLNADFHLTNSMLGINLKSWQFKTAEDFIERDPYSWNVYVSSNGINWILLDDYSGNRNVPNARLALTQEFSFDASSLVQKTYIDNTYSLPIASSNTLGGVKIGSGLAIDANGVLSLDISTVSGVGF